MSSPPDKICAAIERVADKRHGRLCVLGEAEAARRVCAWLATLYTHNRICEAPRRRAFVRSLYEGYAVHLGGPS